MNQNNHSSTEVGGGKKLCPACFFAVQGDEIMLEPGVELHAFAGCLMSWAKLDEVQQFQRLREVKRLADTRQWQDNPQGVGEYWAKRQGSDVLSRVTVLPGLHGLVVRCGETVRGLDDCRGYLYSPRFSPKLYAAA